MESLTLRDILALAFKEDLPHGDLTTDSLALDSRPGHARLVAKQDLILSGRTVFEAAVHMMEPNAKLKWYFDDAQKILKGQQICFIQGDLIQVLKAERVALNFLGHLSGIATLTREYVDQIKHTKAQILDTRKTTPLYRELEKKAVRDGGGTNHRLNLSEAIMIKENHIRAAGSITKAVERIRLNSKKPITVEATNLEEIQECVRHNVARILLDNMTNDSMKQAMEIIPPTIETEASGNMNLQRVRSVAEVGVNFISVGSITHSASTADMSLLFEWS